MRSVPSSHVTSITTRDRTKGDQLTVMLIVQDRFFTPLAEYFHDHDRSYDHKLLTARAVTLLVDFIFADGWRFDDIEGRTRFFSSFASQLRYGSIRDGDDPSGLWWLPRPRYQKLFNSAVAFSDWTLTKLAHIDIGTSNDFPIEARIACWRTWCGQSLAQLKKPPRPQWKSEELVSLGLAIPARQGRTDSGGPPIFSDSDFKILLYKGFIRRGSRPGDPIWLRYNLRDMLVTLLMHGTGLRISEPFHIFTDDIAVDPFDPDVVQVRMFDPEKGTIRHRHPMSGKMVLSNRAEYLRLMHDRVPLTQEGKKTGFKPKRFPRMLLAFWYPRVWGKLFTYLLRFYLLYSRPRSSLPWLFLTLDGLPMTGKAFAERHIEAVKRVGLQVAKELGTTPHGHRHSYAQRLERAKEAGLIDDKTVMVCLHHTTLEAQEIYTTPAISKITTTLRNADPMAEHDDLEGLIDGLQKVDG